MSVNIKYKNNSIATMSDTGTKTLKTSGKYCEADIIVENTKDGGSNELFHVEITPATSGEVLTFEVGETGERIAGVIVSLKTDASIENGKDYAIPYISIINTKPVTSKPKALVLVSYVKGTSLNKSSGAVTQNSSGTPNGSTNLNSFNIWNFTSEKPRVKFYVTNGAESKYGLLVGMTYDIWVIKD